ncbi:transcriptional regulator, MerR family [Acidimicrobium ferrooxidans DSM 10331]|uniref:Transcriptional regulator, MerR family n=1 Tax=Acidimicrobium ferrooxidans (strain DSM 10331 / JCM 15462 / NBRC 103882 / ICP) TaxID=525909 RepID=C7M1X0_ACIFD|nr:MerR family transcriptional regulator [Acidimicrobium ferrooxidans]ACU54867.1 transcriptional regulator, MerR family [Acidimicrobium ferrooxidans DSM 10331]
MAEHDRSHSPERSRGLYVISVAAELTGLHPQTLRVYERRGLLEPRRTGGGSRRYSEADLARLRRIIELTEQGLNLEGVKRVIELEEEVERLRAELDAARQRARERERELHRHYRRDLVPLSQAVIVWQPQRQRTGDAR